MSRAASFVWLVILPGLATALVLRFLVPTPVEARGTWAAGLASVADGHPVMLGVSLFVFSSAMAGYWSAVLSGEHAAAAHETGRGRGLFAVIASAALLALACRAAVGIYRVESASMLPTLAPDDLLLGSRLGYGVFSSHGRLPARGELIVFRKPPGAEGPALLVKRVVGLPGDRITMKGPQLLIDGKLVPACDAGPYLFPLPDGGGVTGRVFVEFLGAHPHLALATFGDPWTGSYEVKPGEVFVVGDNRDASSDSRAWNYGQGAGLPLEAIDGHVDRWVAGKRRDGHTDLDHLLGDLELSLRLPGMDTRSLRDNIAGCLASPPVAEAR